MYVPTVKEFNVFVSADVFSSGPAGWSLCDTAAGTNSSHGVDDRPLLTRTTLECSHICEDYLMLGAAIDEGSTAVEPSSVCEREMNCVAPVK